MLLCWYVQARAFTFAEQLAPYTQTESTPCLYAQAVTNDTVVVVAAAAAGDNNDGHDSSLPKDQLLPAADDRHTSELVMSRSLDVRPIP